MGQPPGFPLRPFHRSAAKGRPMTTGNGAGPLVNIGLRWFKPQAGSHTGISLRRSSTREAPHGAFFLAGIWQAYRNVEC